MPLLVIGVLSDLIGLTVALAILSAVAAVGAAWTWAVGLRSLSGLVPPPPPPPAAGPPGRRVDSTGPMALQESDSEALAATLLEADRAVVLTGLRLGGPESLDLTHADGEWAKRANLEAFLTEPGRFWEYFYPTALAIAGAPSRARPRRPRPARAGRGDRGAHHPGG